jgi:Icc-related predicted phosphoesterase
LADLRLFFATDIHGSDRCMRKFLNAASFYRCDVLLMGGDMTGKMLVPIIDEGAHRYSARLFGRRRVVGQAELPALRKTISDAGFYAYETTHEEIAELEDDPASVATLFERMMVETLERWLALAEERLESTDVMCLMAPGNDDPLFVDDVLASSDQIVNPEGAVVELPGGWSMISVGYSNTTPWDTPREVSEERLHQMIVSQADKLAEPRRAVFNLHVPPRNTAIDQAALLDRDLRRVMRNGSPVIAGMGSTAVRSCIERYQPMLGLHGHIHESRGEARLGRSVCVNPGSEYSEGILRGAIVTLSTRKGLKGYQLVSG